ncbi:arginine deiminase family protein [Weeksellaceae bacterium KMM 9724]|uniref:dimethylarginine dimethylaminohydrolase family protein n=1 Tax=Profundicola chukchiensis TaxID=2961959 RepID=UPI00243C1F9B|nr:arginine deiminase family protein [Profundicola chukchiensis]MDG4949810.1 arginine deiminase family protein [Profundicola chukchiensis]
MILNVTNETDTLKAVVLGQPGGMGEDPELKDTFDSKSRESVKRGIYPSEEDVTKEMEAFEKVLKKHDVQVFRPWVIEDLNQVFSRDVGFVIDDKFIIANLIEDREEEQKAYERIIDSISEKNIIKTPDDVHVEGGDVILWNEFMFVGCYKQDDYSKYKTARTNAKAVEFLKHHFPHKWVIDMELIKDDNDPFRGILHLDCTFQPVGKDKAIIYKNGFLNERHYQILLDLFGRKNVFEVTREEMYWMNTNIFSISPEVVVSEKNFTRLNNHMRNEWGLTVEEIPYREVSKMGGLLRCSTMPLIRE